MTSFLTSLASVERFDPVRDSSGGPKPVWVPVDGLADLSCSVQPASDSLVRLYGGRGIKVDAEIYFDVVHDVRNRDRLLIQGGYYEVVGIRDECLQGRLFVVHATRVT